VASSYRWQSISAIFPTRTGAKVARLTKRVTITARRGDEVIQFTPEDIADGKGRVRLANGLVSPIFRAQGVTVDQAFVLLNDKYDRHDSYVSASRARGDSQICSRGGADLVTEVPPRRIVPDQGLFVGTLPQLHT
jgi:hypothetical protein